MSLLLCYHFKHAVITPVSIVDYAVNNIYKYKYKYWPAMISSNEHCIY